MSEPACPDETGDAPEGRGKPPGRRLARRLVEYAVLVAVVVCIGIIAIPDHSHPMIGRNEARVVSLLRTYLAAQSTFHRGDYYGIGELVYANPVNGAGFPDLYRIGGPDGMGEPLKLVDITFASATSPEKPSWGYYFADITAGPGGPYDYEIDCGLCAVPRAYMQSGQNIFIVDVMGTVYRKDAGEVYPNLGKGDAVRPVTVWPDIEGEGWLSASE